MSAALSIYAIGINTFKEAVRDRILVGILGFAVAVLFFTLALAELALNEQERVIVDIGLATISLCSVLVGIVLGATLLYKEIERKTLYLILPKSISRFAFLLGKYLGILLTGFVFLSCMGAVLCWVAAIQKSGFTLIACATPLLWALSFAVSFRVRDRTAFLIPWSLSCLCVGTFAAYSAQAAIEVVLPAIGLFGAELIVLAAVAMLFSAFSTPFLTGLFTLGVWVLGRSADVMVTMKTNVLTPEIKALLRGIAAVLPNFNLFVPGRHALTERYALGGLVNYMSSSYLYALLYAAALIVVASWIFQRRDFT